MRTPGSSSATSRLAMADVSGRRHRRADRTAVLREDAQRAGLGDEPDGLAGRAARIARGARDQASGVGADVEQGLGSERLAELDAARQRAVAGRAGLDLEMLG